MEFTALSYLATLATMATATPLDKRADYNGRVSPIGERNDDGSLTTCGQEFVTGSKLVAVSPDLLPADCAPRSIGIACGLRAVYAEVADRCAGCTHGHIAVSAAVFSALGGSGEFPLENCIWSF